MEIEPAPRGDNEIFGHPRGLFYLAFTEAWERFSYYGMMALLSLYMVNQILLPENSGNVFGLAAFKAVIEDLTGPLSTQALASQIFGLYAGFVYFTPILGGLIADRWTGQRLGVVIGALLMSAGHIAMAFNEFFLGALILLVLGSGFLKGNISAQVGSLYPKDEEAQRTKGFVIFSLGISGGAAVGPLVCGLLAQWYGWHVGFGFAAGLMLIGLATYLYGYRHLPARLPKVERNKSALTKADMRVVFALVAVIALSIFQSIAYYQLFNVNPIWIQQHVVPEIGGMQIPVAWYQSISSFLCIAGVPLLLWRWRWQALNGGEPDDLAKMSTGAWLAALSNLLLVFAIFLHKGERIHPIWVILYGGGVGYASLYYWPTLLALVSRLAPSQVNSTLMGLVFISLFVSNLLIGWIGAIYEQVSPAMFWAIHAAIAAGGAALIMIFRRSLLKSLGQALVGAPLPIAERLRGW